MSFYFNEERSYKTSVWVFSVLSLVFLQSVRGGFCNAFFLTLHYTKKKKAYESSKTFFVWKSLLFFYNGIPSTFCGVCYGQEVFSSFLYIVTQKLASSTELELALRYL